MVIYLNKIRCAETRFYSLIQSSTHLKSLSMDSIDSKEPAKGHLLFQKELLEVLKKLSDKPLTERGRSSLCSSRPTTKTKSSRSKSKASRCYRIFVRVVPLSKMRIWRCCCFARLWRSYQPTKRAVIRPTGWALSSLPSTVTGKRVTYISVTTPA